MNLGGVLVTLGKTDEAIRFNLHAVLKRPAAALANSQLGMSYYQAGNFDLAVKYLTEARRLDPAHFSHPQLMLADIYARRGRPGDAADILDEFPRHHPDYANAAAIRNQSEALRKTTQSPTR